MSAEYERTAAESAMGSVGALIPESLPAEPTHPPPRPDRPRDEPSRRHDLAALDVGDEIRVIQHERARREQRRPTRTAASCPIGADTLGDPPLGMGVHRAGRLDRDQEL